MYLKIDAQSGQQTTHESVGIRPKTDVTISPLLSKNGAHLTIKNTSPKQIDDGPLTNVINFKYKQRLALVYTQQLSDDQKLCHYNLYQQKEYDSKEKPEPKI